MVKKLDAIKIYEIAESVKTDAALLKFAANRKVREGRWVKFHYSDEIAEKLVL